MFFLPILIGCPATSAVRRCWLQCALRRANLAGGGDGPKVLPRNRCVLVFVDGNAPHAEAPPNFDGSEYVAMVIRELISAVGFQKLRAKIFRQRHPVRPTCAHALSWSRCSVTGSLPPHVRSSSPPIVRRRNRVSALPPASSKPRRWLFPRSAKWRARE